MNKNKVSIIIPYFKKKKYIRRTIMSVISQTYKNIEIIIIYDDEDQTDLLYLKSLKNLDKRIKIIINKNNLGAGQSRNIGISNSNGNYICFLDADDVWKKNKLSYQINYMNYHNCDITHTNYELRNKKNIKIGFRKAKNFYKLGELLLSCDIGLSTVVAKKKIFKNNIQFPKLKTKEDFVLWLKILNSNIHIFGINKNLATWYMTENSLSSSLLQKLKDAFSVYHRYMKFNYIKSLYLVILLSVNFVKKRLFE